MTTNGPVNKVQTDSSAAVVEKHNFRSLEFLRAVCALDVFGSHLFTRIDGAHAPLVAQVVFNFATEAVICFFVLSGCVIALQNYTSKSTYLTSRAVRILPTYYFSLAFTAFIMILVGRVTDIRTVAGNVLFLQDMQGDIVFPLSLNMPLWSLSYEVMYYLVFILILWKRGVLESLFVGSLILGVSTYVIPASTGVTAFIVRVGSLLCVWLLGVLAVRLLRRGLAISMNDAALFLGMGFCLSRVSKDTFDFTRLFMFGAGCAALCSALLSNEVKSAYLGRVIQKQVPVLLRYAFAVTAGMALWLTSSSLVSTKVVLVVGLICVTFVPGIVVWALKRAVMAIAPLLSIVGKLSYALYLVHYPMIYLANYSCRWMTWIGRLSVAAAASILLAYVLDCVAQRRIKKWVSGPVLAST